MGPIIGKLFTDEVRIYLELKHITYKMKRFEYKKIDLEFKSGY